jgi:hypothetical protein
MTIETEELKPIPGYHGRYSITNNGRIFSHKNLKYLVTSKNWHGYEQINLLSRDGKRRNEYIHRLVASAYIPNPSKYKEVNHIDGNKLNNTVENLEWTTRSMNVKKAYDNGLIPKYKSRSKNGNRKETRIYKPGDSEKYFVARKAVVA